MKLLTRRQCLWLGLTTLTTGCIVPEDSNRSPYPNYEELRKRRAQRTPLEPNETWTQTPPKTESKGAPGSMLPSLIPRQSWTSQSLNSSRAKPMNGVSRITIHHEGAPIARGETGFNETARLLSGIRRFHTEEKGWADFGYHFVLDREGRLWEGRPIQFQGAHVRDHNPHNLGIMVLGNFDIQSPTSPQLACLPVLIRELRSLYMVPLSQVRTHQEWIVTACPGRRLQPQCELMRSKGEWG